MLLTMKMVLTPEQK